MVRAEQLVGSIDYVKAEKAASALIRGCRGPVVSYAEMLAGAQVVLGHYQDLVLEDGAEEYLLNDHAAIAPLIAVARVLDTMSRRPEISLEAADNFKLLAGTAYGMYGNVISAETMLSGIARERPLSPGAAVVVGTCAPRLIGLAMSIPADAKLEREYLEALNYFLDTGTRNHVEDLDAALVDCEVRAASSFESLLIRNARVVLRHVQRLGVASALARHGDVLPEGYIAALVASGVKVLLPPQYQAVETTPLLESQANAVISLPTSTGKTLLGELCLAAALGRSPGVVCYLAPYVALGRQVVDSLRKHLPKNCRVHPYLGGFRTTDVLAPELGQDVIVATPESFDAILRSSPEILSLLRAVVVDEAHVVENGARGARLEGLLTRLQLLRKQQRPIRIVLLSAVLSQLETLTRWLDVPEKLVIRNTWKPTARRLAFWRQSGELVYVQGDDPVRYEKSDDLSVVGVRTIPWPERHVRASQRFDAVLAQEPLVNRNVAYLVESLWRQFEGPVLCACATKAGTRKVARAIAERFEPVEPLPTELQKIVRLIDDSYPHLRDLRQLVVRAVTFHNTTVPHDVRTLIEDAIRAMVVKAVAATTTLAEGVDLPFRATVLVDWLSWIGDAQRPMSKLTFRNIAGRCGRAGVFTEGDTIIFDNPLGNIDFTNPAYRHDIQKSLLSPPEQLTSVFTRQSEATEADEIDAALGSQLLAAIPENPHVEDLPTVFAMNTYAAKGCFEKTTEAKLKAAATVLMDEELGALARAASPLRLTELGVASNLTGLSPNSCRALIRYLKGFEPRREIVEVGSEMLRLFGTLPEQQDVRLRKMLRGKRVRFAVKADDFEAVISMWLSRMPLMAVFASLPSVRKSRRNPPVDIWASGEQTSEDWSQEFDRFVEFANGAFENYLPWLFRACDVLAPLSGEAAMSFRWRDSADLLESRGDDEMRDEL